MSLSGLFIVGTDTDVGKTAVACSIARAMVREGRRVGVLKPVSSGGVTTERRLESADARRLIDAIGSDVDIGHVGPIVFEEPLAPPVAARRLGIPLLWDDVKASALGCLDWWEARAEVMVVEGVGGLLCPLAEGATVADLATWLDYPIVIVAHRGLGTLNHTLLTVEAARSRGLRIAGIVLNAARPTTDPVAEETNVGELRRRLDGVPILGVVDHRLDGDDLLGLMVDWLDLAELPRHTREPSRR